MATNVIYKDLISDLQAIPVSSLEVGQIAVVQGSPLKWDGTQWVALGPISVLAFGAHDDPDAFTSPDNPATEDQFQFFDAAANFNPGMTIIVPRGRYRVAQQVSSPAFWLLAPGASVTGAGRARIGSYNKTSLLTGLVQDFNNRPAGGDGSPFSGSTGFRFGDPEPYESDFIGHSATASISGIGRNGGVGVLSATRSSTNTAPSGTPTLQVGAALYAVQDNTTNLNNVVTAAYTEATRMPGTATTFAQETTVKNFGALVDVNALSPAGPAAGATGGIQLIPLAGPESLTASGSVDLTEWPTAERNHSSYAIGMIGQVDEGGVGFNRGILIFKGSIASGNAIDMYEGYNITWRSDGGSVDSQMAKDNIRLSFGNSTVASDSSTQIFWRYRGSAVSRTNTIAQDALGRTTYHGHTDSLFGFTQATNALVDISAEQASGLTGNDAVGRYKLRVNDGSGEYKGFNLNPTSLAPVTPDEMNLGSPINRMNTIHAVSVNADTVTPANGASGTFTAQSGETVTVTNGIITSIA